VRNTLYVTPAQVLAAKLDVELREEAGEESDEAIQAIANAYVVFTRDYVTHESPTEVTYEQGTNGMITRVHTGPLGGITHVDVRLQDGHLVREVPIDYFTD
jgi:hypothetical protein